EQSLNKPDDGLNVFRNFINALPDELFTIDADEQVIVESPTFTYNAETSSAIDLNIDVESLECEWQNQIHTAWYDKAMAAHVNSCIVCHRKWQEMMRHR